MRVVTQTDTDPRTHTDARYMDTERLTDARRHIQKDTYTQADEKIAFEGVSVTCHRQKEKSTFPWN